MILMSWQVIKALCIPMGAPVVVGGPHHGVPRLVVGELDAAQTGQGIDEPAALLVVGIDVDLGELQGEAVSVPFLGIPGIFDGHADAQAFGFGEQPRLQRVVPQILQELEGFDRKTDRCLLFIGATNKPWMLDEAMMRPGRPAG